MINTNNMKTQMAIEFKYLGLSNKEIAERLIGVSVSTVAVWFDKKKGKLRSEYEEYSNKMQKGREEHLKKQLYLQDDEILTISTNTARVFAQQNLQPRQIPLRNKITGEITYNKEGDPIMVDYRPIIKFADVKRVWEMQRVMRGLPTNYERADINQTNYQEDQIIKELGLTPDDFKDDKRIATAKRISDYLATK